MQAIKQNQVEIYWEKQADDQLCGVHCINSLLQGPFFNEIELANIALDLDKQELALLGGENQQNYKNQQKGGSNNVGMDGNYSIQVLSESLLKMGKLTVESVDKQINKNQDLSNETGFICNSSDHWFSIRKVNGVFYNLNSLSKIGPEIISEFYLSAFLIGVRENGFSIFVVKGEYPDSSKILFGGFQKHQIYFTPEQIQQNMKANKGKKQNFFGSDQENLDKAIEESLKDMKQREGEFVPPGQQEQEQEKEKNQFQAFKGQGLQIQSSTQNIDYPNMFLDPNQDPEFIMVVQASLQEKFSKNIEKGITINFRSFNGNQFKFTFPFDSRVEDLYDFVYIQYGNQKVIPFYIQLNYPQIKVLNNINKSILDEGIEDMTLLYVQKL